jgi:hypothetical protein
LGAGEIGFESDTNKFKIGTGSTAWVSLPYASNVSPLTTKGDLYTYSTDNARLAVGANGETLVADSSTATGLRWQGDYAAGKNKFINGDFGIDQRQTSSTTSNGAYIFDRWGTVLSGGTVTYSKQTFTPGAAPVAGYEATNYLRAISSGQATGNYAAFSQNIEDVRTFAGQTVTVSFWAKAGTGTPNVGVRVRQFFGTGGSTAVATIATAQAITTSWARYSFTVAVPSISGKTIGTENTTALSLQIIFSDDTTFSSGVGIQNGTFEFWGLQIEGAQTASNFQTATGTKQGELAACQRYFAKSYQQQTAPATAAIQSSIVIVNSLDVVPNNNLLRSVSLPVVMRTAPTVTVYGYAGGSGKVSDGSGTDLAASSGSVQYAGDSGFTVYNAAAAITPSSGGFLFHYAASAEL